MVRVIIIVPGSVVIGMARLLHIATGLIFAGPRGVAGVSALASGGSVVQDHTGIIRLRHGGGLSVVGDITLITLIPTSGHGAPTDGQAHQAMYTACGRKRLG